MGCAGDMRGRKPRRRWEDNIKMDIEETERECVCPGSIQVRLGTRDRLLYRRYCTFGFHAIQRIS